MIGDWLKEQRTARGWTQVELSERSGVNAEYIRHLEKNRRPKPGADVLRGLADAFDMTVDQVMIEAGLVPPPAVLAALEGAPDPALQELIRSWPQLTPSDRETALAVTRSLLERRTHGKHHPVTPESHPAVS